LRSVSQCGGGARTFGARRDELISDLEAWIRSHIGQSMDQIARAIGYGSATSLGRLLRAHA